MCEDEIMCVEECIRTLEGRLKAVFGETLHCYCCPLSGSGPDPGRLQPQMVWSRGHGGDRHPTENHVCVTLGLARSTDRCVSAPNDLPGCQGAGWHVPTATPVQSLHLGCSPTSITCTSQRLCMLKPVNLMSGFGDGISSFSYVTQKV